MERAPTCSFTANPNSCLKFPRPGTPIPNQRNKKAYSSTWPGRTGHWNNSIHKCCCSACCGVRARTLHQIFGSTLIHHLHLDKVELVKDIIVALAKHLESGAKIEEWVGLDLDRFLSNEKVALDLQHRSGKQRRARYGSLFAEREFDSRYVLSVGDPFEVRKLTAAHQKFKRRGHLLTCARAKVTR